MPEANPDVRSREFVLNRSRRFLIGLSEIARIAEDLKYGLEENGQTADILLWQRNRFYPNTPCLFVAREAIHLPPGKPSALGWIRLQGALIAKLFSTLRRYDVYVLIHSDTFLPGNLDVPLLRLLGKQVVRIWCGSDVRYWHAYEQEMRKLGMEKDVASFLESIRGKRFDRYLQKRDMVRIGERFANLIYAQASYAQLFKRPYLRINLPMAVNEYVYNFPDRDVPLVVHAPSSKERKGTRAILRAVDELHAEGLSFEFRIVQNCSNEQVRIALQEADIVVDQLISAIIGKLALEGMSCGCAVLGRYAPEYAPVPPGCPMIRVTEETIKERLREVIVNRDLRRRLAVEGRQYVETYYDRRVFAKNMLAALESGPPPMHTTTPTFYREYRPKLSLILQETGDFFHDIFKSVSRMGVKPDSR